ncbi:MAG: tRNA (guanine-N1)-methyltransferase [bacterium]
MKLQQNLLICFAFLISGLFWAQNANTQQEASRKDGTINQQFEYVINKSNRYKDEKGRLYKVVRRIWLDELKTITQDSLVEFRKKIADANSTIANQLEEINSLKTNLSNTQNDLTATNQEKDSMSLFGMQMSKTGYNTLMWSVIAGLLALLLFFIFKFKNSNAITKAAKKSLEDIEQEFEDHRRVALEREQKVRRQLQDEINKQKKSNS